MVTEKSYASLDLNVRSPGLVEPLNLHASAQLGAWPADRPEAAPKEASSDKWWKGVEGWWATITPYNGSFMPVRGREIQLSKRRFGRGEWLLVATLSDVATANGAYETIRWPKDGAIVIRAD